MLKKIIKIATICGVAILATGCDQQSPTPADKGDTTVAHTDATANTPNTTDVPAATTTTTSTATAPNK